jgi:hypothetical protein
MLQKWIIIEARELLNVTGIEHLLSKTTET